MPKPTTKAEKHWHRVIRKSVPDLSDVEIKASLNDKGYAKRQAARARRRSGII